MIEPESYSNLKAEISERMASDYGILEELREEVRPLRGDVRRIQPRSATSISLVGTDGGNNRVQFDPFLVQLIRVVDSSNNEYCLEAITPTTPVSDLSSRQFDQNGLPATALGRMMAYMHVTDLTQLSHMIRRNDDGRPTSPSWVQVYRELIEWAILFDIVRNKDFGTDTLIVFDGLLRSKVFARELFRTYLQGLEQAIRDKGVNDRRKIFIAGIAKHSKVLSRYRLALALEHVLTTDYPAYLEIPRGLEEKAYVWSEYARGDDRELAGAEINKFVGGKMFFVKFGNSSHDPIWPIDLFLPQAQYAQEVMGYLLSDAINGFPVPHYPRCLQRAHENAALVEFDFDLLQDQILVGIRNALGTDAPILDIFRLQDTDPSQRRYS